MIRTTITDNGVKIITNNLSEQLHNIVVTLIENDYDRYNQYYLLQEDDDGINDLIDLFSNTGFSDNNEFANLLIEALTCNSDVYSVCDDVGNSTEPIGTIIVIWQDNI